MVPMTGGRFGADQSRSGAPEAVYRTSRPVSAVAPDPTASRSAPRSSCATAPTPKVVSQLWEKWRIIATPIMHAEYEGLRVTPNVYTTLEEVDTFAAAMERIAG